MIDFVPDEPGDGAMHCHMTHHAAVQMGHEPWNMDAVDEEARRRIVECFPQYVHGAQPAWARWRCRSRRTAPRCAVVRDYSRASTWVAFTILKVRGGGAPSDFDGWYKYPKGSVAGTAPARMKQDGIDLSSGRKKAN